MWKFTFIPQLNDFTIRSPPEYQIEIQVVCDLSLFSPCSPQQRETNKPVSHISPLDTVQAPTPTSPLRRYRPTCSARSTTRYAKTKNHLPCSGPTTSISTTPPRLHLVHTGYIPLASIHSNPLGLCNLFPRPDLHSKYLFFPSFPQSVQAKFASRPFPKDQVSVNLLTFRCNTR